jgi:hypothetical protein
MSELLTQGLKSTTLQKPLDRADASRLSAEIESLTGLRVYPLSISATRGRSISWLDKVTSA